MAANRGLGSSGFNMLGLDQLGQGEDALFQMNVPSTGTDKNSEKISAGFTYLPLENIIPNIPKFKQSIILQHDTKQFSVEAVEDIIVWGLENGYTFKTLSEDSFVYHHPINN